MTNLVRFDGDYAYIRCHAGREAKIDRADVAKVSKANGTWLITDRGYVSRHIRDKETGAYTIQYLHRFLLNPPDHLSHLVIDHIDGDPTNNTRANLQLISPAANLRKQRIGTKPRENNLLGCRGISMSKSGRYIARVVNEYLGSYDTLIEAQAAFEVARVGINFARTGRA